MVGVHTELVERRERNRETKGEQERKEPERDKKGERGRQRIACKHIPSSLRTSSWVFSDAIWLNQKLSTLSIHYDITKSLGEPYCTIKCEIFSD